MNIRCIRCGKSKARTLFSIGATSWCSQCVREDAAARRAKTRQWNQVTPRIPTYSAKAIATLSRSWWLDMPSQGFTAAAGIEQPRMACSKFGGAGKPFNGSEA